MDFSIDQIADVGVFFLENKKELIEDLKNTFTRNINQRRDFPTGFYLSSYDTKLDSKMREYLAKTLVNKFGLSIENSHNMLEENNIKHVVKDIIKESYE